MYREIGNAIEVASTNKPLAVNDLATSVASAHSPGGSFLQQLNANRSSMKTQALAQAILNHSLPDYRMR